MSKSVIEQAIRDARDILWDNLRPTNKLRDEAAVQALRAIVRTPRAQTAIERANDTALTFVLRTTSHVLSDELRTPRDTISALWNIFSQLDLDRLLDIPPNARMKVGPKKPPAG